MRLVSFLVRVSAELKPCQDVNDVVKTELGPWNWTLFNTSIQAFQLGAKNTTRAKIYTPETGNRGITGFALMVQLPSLPH